MNELTDDFVLCDSLDDYLAGELPAELRLAFDQHLATCEACRLAVNEWQTLCLALETATGELENPSPSLLERLQAGAAVSTPPAHPDLQKWPDSQKWRVSALVLASLVREPLQVLDPLAKGLLERVVRCEIEGAARHCGQRFAIGMQTGNGIGQRRDVIDGHTTAHGRSPQDAVESLVGITDDGHATGHRFDIRARGVALPVATDKGVDLFFHEGDELAGEVEHAGHPHAVFQPQRTDLLPQTVRKNAVAADGQLERHSPPLEFLGDERQMVRAFHSDQATGEGQP